MAVGDAAVVGRGSFYCVPVELRDNFTLPRLANILIT